MNKMTRRRHHDRHKHHTDQKPPAKPVNIEAHMNKLKSALKAGSLKCAIEPRMMYYPVNEWNSPYFYPQIPLAQYGTPGFFIRLSEDTLFFIFYYFPMAARELMRLSWRYHKKHSTWYKRHQEPTRITDTYEKGTYVYFDPEEWKKCIKSDFTFYYSQLLS